MQRVVFALAIPITSLPQLILKYFYPIQVLILSVLVLYRAYRLSCFKINEKLDNMFAICYLVHLRFFLTFQFKMHFLVKYFPPNMQHVPVVRHKTVLGGPPMGTK